MSGIYVNPEFTLQQLPSLNVLFPPLGEARSNPGNVRTETALLGNTSLVEEGPLHGMFGNNNMEGGECGTTLAEFLFCDSPFGGDNRDGWTASPTHSHEVSHGVQSDALVEDR